MPTDHDDKHLTFFRFEDLRVYHKALDYAVWVMHSSMNLPGGLEPLREQFQRSASSIAVYISEGSARNKNQFIYYLKMAKSAVRECLVYSTICYSMNLLNQRQEEESRNQLMELTKMIGALIGSLMKAAHHYHGEDEDDDMHDPS